MVRRLKKDKVFLVALFIMTAYVVMALFADQLSPFHYAYQKLPDALRPPVWAGGSLRYPLGTDHMGRDILSRIIYGSRVSLSVATAAVILAGVVGTALGLISGFVGGKTDNVIMRLADIQLSFPPILLSIAILTSAGHNIRNIIIVLGFIGWVQYARVIRGSALAVREREFIEAARASGCSTARMIIRHVFPNVLPELMVVTTTNVSAMILAEASLSFLGLGLRPPTPAWGSMLTEARGYFTISPWYPLFPGLAIVGIVLAVNIVGNRLSV